MKKKTKVILRFLVLFSAFLFLNDLRAEKANLCLTMIVKNEEQIIERCLDSVRGIVDCISICDTGSTDKTVQIIEAYMQRNGIPGKVHHQAWKNFGYNRTLSVETAQKLLRELGYPLQNTFLLLLDADMLLEKPENFSKDCLYEDSYKILQKTYAHSFYNTRLIRASLPWKSVGVTHEYWSCQVPCREANLKTLAIDDRNDGGSKSDKFERDIKMLTQGLEDEPENSRYVFYLATSYHCLNNYEEAIKWYKIRIDKGGWFEEVWYSKYMIGTCYEELNQWDQALSYYLQAYQCNSERAEPLQRISRYYRLKEQYDLAYFFAKQGASIPYPSQQLLFISYPVYDYLLDEDLSVAAFYTSFKEEGYAATNRLNLKKEVPRSIKEQSYKNMLFYVQNLKNAHYEPIKITLPKIREGFTACYNPMNPSIKKTKEGYDVICRTVNYMQIGARHFKSIDWLDPNDTVKTRNFLLRYDFDFNLLLQQEIIEDLPRERIKNYNIEGLEDCRVFDFNGSIWFTCTTVDTNPCGQHQISLCKLEKSSSNAFLRVEKLIPLMGPDPFRCEKNWLPFVKDDAIHVVYSCDPLIIYKPNIEDDFSLINHNVLALHQSQKHDFSRFSGSASPIEFDHGYLMLVHETVYDEQRIYLHRFVYLDRDFNITKVSKPFIFIHKGIEYCCGMAIDHAQKNLVMTIGIEDREAYFCHIDLATVRSLLESL